MNKRVAQKQKTRQKLLDASLELFVQKGYEGTTVRDIAEKAGVTVGLLFFYFPTKEAVLDELLDIAALGTAAAQELLACSKDPLVVFEDIAEMILNSLEDPTARNIFMLVNQVLTFQLVPAGQIKGRGLLHIVHDSIKVIEQGQREGCIKAGEPTALAVAYWGALQGIAETLAWMPDAKIPKSEYVVDILRAT